MELPVALRLAPPSLPAHLTRGDDDLLYAELRSADAAADLVPVPRNIDALASELRAVLTPIDRADDEEPLSPADLARALASPKSGDARAWRFLHGLHTRPPDVRAAAFAVVDTFLAHTIPLVVEDDVDDSIRDLVGVALLAVARADRQKAVALAAPLGLAQLDPPASFLRSGLDACPGDADLLDLLDRWNVVARPGANASGGIATLLHALFDRGRAVILDAEQGGVPPGNGSLAALLADLSDLDSRVRFTERPLEDDDNSALVAHIPDGALLACTTVDLGDFLDADSVLGFVNAIHVRLGSAWRVASVAPADQVVTIVAMPSEALAAVRELGLIDLAES